MKTVSNLFLGCNGLCSSSSNVYPAALLATAFHSSSNSNCPAALLAILFYQVLEFCLFQLLFGSNESMYSNVLERTFSNVRNATQQTSKPNPNPKPSMNPSILPSMFKSFSYTKCRSQLFAKVSYFSTTTSSNNTISLKKLIQPFVVKCHPDMAQQQGLPKTAQKVNLFAIQNLNSYVDGTMTLEKGGAYPFSSYEPSGLMEIEFVMSFAKTGTKSANPTTSRRKVELRVPPPTMDLKRVTPHVQRQVVKLLRMADLPVPSLDLGADEEEHQQRMTDPNRQGGISEAYMANQVMRSSRKTAWDRSRDRFHSRLNWKKYDEMYKEALGDAQAHQMTKNMIR